MDSAGNQFELGPFLIDEPNGRLLFSGEEVTIEPRVLSLMTCLAKKKGRLVTKEELFETVWMQRSVSDGAISTAVASLRKTLSRDPFHRIEIRSVYGRGLLLSLTEAGRKESSSNLPLITALDRLPRICVLPLRLIGDIEIGKSVSRSIEEEVYSGLCRSKAFFVQSRQTSAQFLPDEILTKNLRDDFSLDYAIDGSLSVFDDSFRVHLFILDLKRDSPIWSADFKGEIARIFDDQADIVRRLVGSALPEVLNCEIKYVARRNPAEWDAYDRLLAAMPHCWRLNRESNMKAVLGLESALEIEPNYGLALSLKAWCLAQRIIYSWTDLAEFPKEAIFELSARAIELDGDNPFVLTVYSMAMTLLGELQTAHNAVTKALEVDPNLAWGWNRLGWVDGYNCRVQSSIEGFERSLLLSPLDPMRFNCYFGIAQAHFVDSEYEHCIDWLDKALFERRDATFMHRLRAAACFYSGDTKEAKRSAQILIEDNKSFDPIRVANLVPFSDSSVRDRLAAGIQAVM